jgi:hypothetical protein
MLPWLWLEVPKWTWGSRFELSQVKSEHQTLVHSKWVQVNFKSLKSTWVRYYVWIFRMLVTSPCESFSTAQESNSHRWMQSFSLCIYGVCTPWHRWCCRDREIGFRVLSKSEEDEKVPFMLLTYYQHNILTGGNVSTWNLPYNFVQITYGSWAPLLVSKFG